MEKHNFKKRKHFSNYELELETELGLEENIEELYYKQNNSNFVFSDEEIENKIYLPQDICTIPEKLITKCPENKNNYERKYSSKKETRDNRDNRDNKYNNKYDKEFRYNKFEKDKKNEIKRTRLEFFDEDDEPVQNLLNLKNIFVACENSLCDHKTHNEDWYDNNKITITSVNTLNDLITLSNFYHCKMRVEYNGIDMKILHNIKKPLVELNNMIGLNKIKEEIVNNIIYFLLTRSLSKEINSDMMHAVITGSPGCGKTTFIDILAKIYVGLGVLQKGQVVKTRRSELIGKYLGHTAVQTQQKITEAYGGILLIDEAYSLGNPEGRDSFSKECLDTLNQELSENKGKFICIIAGYKDALDNSFFRYNEGLKRRFPFRYEIEKYNAEELTSILLKKIEEYGFYGIHKISLWKPEFTKLQLQNLIKENYKFFVNQGGDMETLFLNAKIAQNKRVFLLSKEDKNKLLLVDIKTSIDKFLELNKCKNDNDDFYMRSMYL